MPAEHSYLRPEDIRRLQSYEFGAKAMVEGYLSGKHRSRERGASIEFHEYRPYSPGDDPALVDWRVFARTEKHFLRTFEQETNLEAHLFLDSSASMGFRGETSELSKLEYASFFAACLAWLIVRHRDRVSLQIFDDTIRHWFAPSSTRSHLHEILNALESNEPGGETSLAAALEKAAPLIRRRGTLVVVSDFFDDPAEIFRALNPYLHRGFRVHLFHVLDPDEWELSDRGLSRFVDSEDGRSVTVHPRTVREGWKEEIQNHIRSLRRLASTRQVDYAQVLTTDSYFTLFDRMSD